MKSELAEAVQSNLYDALLQVRSTWFSRRSRTGGAQLIYIYLDDPLMGTTAGTLRSVSVNFPDRVRYLSPTDAQIRFGIRNNMAAAIVLEVDRQ